MSSIYDWSTTEANNATADSGINWQEGQLPSTVNNSARFMMRRGKEILNDLGAVATAAGTANAITVTASSPFSAYVKGIRLLFKASATNTGAATLNVNAVGAKAVVYLDAGSELPIAAGFIVAGGLYEVIYDPALASGSGAWVLIKPPQALYITSQSKSADYTAVLGDRGSLINVDASGAVRTITLPAAATAGNGFTITVKKSDNSANAVIVDGNASETIDGALTRTLTAQYQSVSIVCDGTGWRVISVSGVPIIVTGTSQATTSGTAFDFLNIPPGVKRITVMFDLVSLSGTDDILVQLGTSGGLETTGYSSGSGGASTSAAGYIVRAANAARAPTGQMVITNQTGNTWVSSHVIHSDTTTDIAGGGRKVFAGVVDRLRVTRTGTDTFDGGAVNILYE